jgi:hypothetical protein
MMRVQLYTGGSIVPVDRVLQKCAPIAVTITLEPDRVFSRASPKVEAF